MMNLKPIQIIAIGAGFVFGLPILIGLIVGNRLGFGAGVFTGFLILGLVSTITITRKISLMHPIILRSLVQRGALIFK